MNNIQGTLTGFSLSGATSNWVASATTVSGSFVNISAPAPTITGISSSISACYGGSATLTVTVSGCGSQVFNWYRGATWLASTNSTSYLVTNITSAGTYLCVVSSTGGVVTSSGMNVVFDCNNALNFDGVNDNFLIPNIFNTPPTKFSVEFWLKPNNLTDFNQSLSAVNTWGSFAFHSSANGSVYVGTDISNRFTPSDLPAGTVELLIMVRLASIKTANY